MGHLEDVVDRLFHFFAIAECRVPDGTVLEDVVDGLFRFFAIAECRVHDANLLQVCSQATVSCSQPEFSGLLMSCQTVDWVS